jgi:hypothetical protein
VFDAASCHAAISVRSVTRLEFSRPLPAPAVRGHRCDQAAEVFERRFPRRSTRTGHRATLNLSTRIATEPAWCIKNYIMPAQVFPGVTRSTRVLGVVLITSQAANHFVSERWRAVDDKKARNDHITSRVHRGLRRVNRPSDLLAVGGPTTPSMIFTSYFRAQVGYHSLRPFC